MRLHSVLLGYTGQRRSPSPADVCELFEYSALCSIYLVLNIGCNQPAKSDPEEVLMFLGIKLVDFWAALLA